MTRRHQLDIEAVAIISFAAALSMFFVWRTNQNNQQLFHVNSPVIKRNTDNHLFLPLNIAPTFTPVSTSMPTPSPTPVLIVDLNSQISADGTKKLLMKTTHNIDGSLTYSFSTTDGSDNNEQKIYNTTLSGTDTMNIPFNAFAPDNKYFYILKNGTDA